MDKVRINDLARELEVKSKAILDLLPSVGVTEKKSHSSSIDPEAAEKVRKHFSKGEAAADKPRAKAPAEEFKPKIDLSKISKPGDVLKAIQKTSAPEAPAKPEPPKPTAPIAQRPAAPVAPAKPAPVPVAPAAVRPPAPPAAAPPVPATIPSIEAAAAPPKPAAPIAQRPAAPVAQAPVASAPSAPAVPPRRVITPQTGPRPVYAAPQRPATVTPGQPIGQRPIAARPVPGRPVPGQPIFQRPRPAAGAPGTRPPLRPGERRPMHPTRTAPSGMRPGMPRPGGLPGAPPAGAKPAGRAAPARRPGQSYVPRGVKEGPMKGFRPPPTMPSISSEPLPITRTITVTEGISVKDLAEKLEVRAKDLIARLLAKGVMATINQTLDSELASEMSRQFGAETKVISFEEHAEEQVQAELAGQEDAGVRRGRPPVVTIMGHVDHGKTSLLDAIRQTSVAEGEAGGITQHIGAYKVKIQDPNSPAVGREIVFLDTPGHEAFTRMRARGAKVTDIVVLVVAADDGVMPQTLEAIDHSTAANVPIIVAINKIDKPDALPERPKKQLADRGLMPEDWGGKTVFVEVSAKKKTNRNLLLEMILLVADLQELRAAPERPATGSVLEAKLDRGRGAIK